MTNAATAVVRLDDMRQHPALAWQFEGLTTVLRAASLPEVVPTLQAAEAAARAGQWAVGFVSYEAAPAFDGHLRVSSGHGTWPLAWFGLFDTRTAVADLDAQPDPARTLATATRRIPGTLPYRQAVDRIRSRIEAGDVYQVNLAERAEGTVCADPWELYVAMMRAQRSAYGAYLDLGSRVVVSASPELFFRWDEHGITARPMKGTAPRHPDPGIDHGVGEALRRSRKDQAENVMIVDLLRNDLSRVAEPGGVEVPELFTLERYETVWQLTSTVRAQPRADITVTDVFRAAFPCGSITGAPKDSAMALIADLEGNARQVYCGAIGYIAPAGHQTRAVFSVPIRTAVVDRAARRFSFGVGAGITWPSTAEGEDAEVDSKCRVLHEHRPTFALLDTMRHDPDGIRHLDRHLARLEASADWFAYRFDRRAVRRQLLALTAPAESMRLRVTVRRHGEVTCDHSAITASTEPVTLALDRGHHFASDDAFCAHKTTYRAHYDRARARHPETDDVILLNERGELTETTIANLAIQLDGVWCTPARHCGGLPGIGRQVMLECRQLRERVLYPSDLERADAVAVVNDLRGWRSAVVLGAG